MKTADALKQIYTVNYLYQSGEITSKELDKRLTKILKSYAKKRAIKFGVWVQENQGKENFDFNRTDTDGWYDEFINPKQ